MVQFKALKAECDTVQEIEEDAGVANFPAFWLSGYEIAMGAR